MSDEYSPSEVKPERTHRQDNHERHYQTKPEDDLGAILARLSLGAILARLSRGSLPSDFRIANQEVIPLEALDGQGRPMSAKADYVVYGRVYGRGVFRVNGGVHRQRKKAQRDERQRMLLEALGYWVEDVENREVKQERIFSLLESHRRTIA
jgi:hypothetical protein